MTNKFFKSEYAKHTGYYNEELDLLFCMSLKWLSLASKILSRLKILHRIISSSVGN